MHLGILDVAHALIVADGQREKGDDHRLAVDDVAVEQLERVGDLHNFVGLVCLVNDGVHRAREVVGGGDLDVGAGGGLRSEVCRGGEIVVAGFGLHAVGTEDVPPALDEAGFAESEISVAAGLVHLLPPVAPRAAQAGCPQSTSRFGIPLMCPRRGVLQTSGCALASSLNRTLPSLRACHLLEGGDDGQRDPDPGCAELSARSALR